MTTNKGKPLFTAEEISHIEKNLGEIVFDWAKHLVQNIITSARSNGVDTVYINSSDSVFKASNEDKTDFFYERLPKLLGFVSVQKKLRGKKERFWAYYINEQRQASGSGDIAFNQIPPNKQGMFLKLFGRKPHYNRNEVAQALEMLKNKQVKPKSGPAFFYDWDSRTWNGAQRFRNDIHENVVLQKLTKDAQEKISNDPILLKFWSFILSQSGHFGQDVIGFALLCRLNKQEWLINEIQTDCLNRYFNLRRPDKTPATTNITSWETIKDMLTAQNRSNWILQLEGNEQMKQKLMRDPNAIGQLCDNTHNIQEWLIQNEEWDPGATVTRNLQAFSRRVFLIG